MKNKILTILSAIMGLLFLNGGINKFLNYMPVPADLDPELVKDFQALVEISWLIPLIAVAEIIAGLLLIFPRTRALGVLIIFPVAVGILLTHIVVDPSQLMLPIAIWAILVWNIYDNREKFLAIIK